MNVVKCVNGHFFDSDSYQLCPHCGGALSDGGMESTVQEKPKKKGLFSGWKKSSEKADTSAQIHETVRESSEKTVQKTENPEPVFE